MRPHVSLIALLTLVAAPLAAQGTRLLRQPNAGATDIVFIHGGDVWIAPRAGGNARHLTSFPGTESYPRLSPDGKLVAFTAEYGGNEDVYVMPSEGGEPRRLTWHPGRDEVRGWTPDGKAILFASGRTGAPLAIPKFWTVSKDGGAAVALPLPEANRGTFSPDGTHLAYQRTSPWDVEFRNYRGGQAQPIRFINLKTLEGDSVPSPPRSGDTDPVWLGDAIYFLSDRDLAVNVYAYDTKSKAVRQLTHYRDFDAKQLSAGGGVLTYELAGYVHLFDPASGTDTQLAITAQGDLPWARAHYEDVSKRLQSPSVSPTGARVAFEARGEIVSVPAEKGDWRNLSATPGAADRRPFWSPDGKAVAWFSDASGEYKLVIRPQDGVSPAREIALPKPTYYFTPSWSPDGKHIAYTDTGLNVWILDVATGKATIVDTDLWMVPSRTVDPAWSPDSKWLAYSKRLQSQYHAVFAYSLAEGKAHQVTDGLSDALNPAWDASGKYLYFLASTNFGLNTGWLDMSSYEHPVERAVYLAVLRAADKSPLLPESDEEGAKPDSTAARPDSAALKGKAKSDVKAKPVVPPADSIKVQIDFDGLSQRILALGVPARDYSSLTTGAAGVLFFAELVPNQPGITLHRYELVKRQAKPFLAGIGAFALSRDGKKVLYGGLTDDWGLVASDGTPKVGDGKLNTAIKVAVDPSAEWKQMFHEAWRFERDFFYVPNLHGADWAEVERRYSPWLADVQHRSDLTYMLDILGGELSVGHSFVFGGDTPVIDTVRTGMLGADLSVDNGALRITRIFTGENWNPGLRAPLSEPGVTVKEGDYLLAVNGVPVVTTLDPYRAFEATANRQTILSVNDKPTISGARTITVVPIADELALRSRAWVEGNRRLVDKLSGGRLAYVWLPNTAEAGYTYFNRYYFAQQEKDGVILDERFNGGGSLADYFIDVLSRTQTGYFNNPIGDRRPFTAPGAGIWGPKVMLINEYAGSGGDALPFMFHQRKLGPLVGHRTWGGLVGIWDAPPLMDGGVITTPRGGFFNLDGEWDVENKGIDPDITVEQTPKDAAAGADLQLLRGVDEGLKLLHDHPVRRLKEPAPPQTVQRPPR